jgi:hypothetical protein
MVKVGVVALAVLALPGLLGAQDDLAAAEKEFKSALQMQAGKPMEDAIKGLLKINSPAAAKVVLGGLRVQGETEVYWMIVNGAAAFTSTSALKEVTAHILANKTSPVARDLVSGLHGNSSPACETALIEILKEGNADLQILAVEHMMDVGEKSTVDAVIAALKQDVRNPELSRRLFRVLNVLCKETYGETLSNWEGWWNANKHKPWSELRAQPQGTKGGTGTVCDELGKHRDSEYEKLKTGKVLVIGAKTGCKCKQPHDLDNIERMCERMRLQVDVKTKLEFARESVKLDDYVAILCNCTHLEVHCCCPKCRKGGGGDAGLRLVRCPNCDCGHPSASYVMGPAGLNKIRKYVDDGGYLFTEDWALREILSTKFKEFVETGEFVKSDMEVSIFPKQGAGTHPYLRKIFSRLRPKPPEKAGSTKAEDSPADFERLDHTWKIDRDSPTIKIKDKARVTTLIYSKDVGALAGGNGSDAVAVTFIVSPKGQPAADPVATGAPIEQDRTKMSGGRVLHVMSHFGKQKNLTDEYTIQNLLINFLIEASERKGIKLEKK